MKLVYFLRRLGVTALILAILSAQDVAAEPKHAIAMYGEPALPPDFVSLPYVNADAPKGGAITLSNVGSFDSLNPYVAKGNVPWQLRFFTHESLMGRSQDEPFTLYGLLAESIETPPDRSWVEFTLRPEARFSDGSPVTVEDVIWSFRTLGTEGHGRYRGLWSQTESIEQTGPRSLRITFNTENRELALLAGMRPVLQKAQWEGKTFSDARLEDIPIGSGPYVITDYEAARFVRLERNPDYWGADLPLRRGTNNIDQIKIDFYGDGDVVLEGLKSGNVSALREFNAERWASQFNFPRVDTGDVIKTEIPHQKPSGMTGFAINTRRAPFDDWRVRQALIETFNFEYINETLTGGAQPRITSYFSNSPLAMRHEAATGRVAELLSPFAGTLPTGAVEGYDLPVSDGTLRNRRSLRRALNLFEEAGWTLQDGALKDARGTPLTLTILLPQNRTEERSIADIYVQGLERVGIAARAEVVDEAQFTERETSFDFDLVYYRRALSLSPGNEQRFYFGSASAEQEGSRNLMGAAHPAIDAMIDTMLNATSRDDFIAATRALDRVLMAQRYVIPFWQYTTGRIAHVRQMKYPEQIPIYGDGPNYMPELWWWSEN